MHDEVSRKQKLVSRGHVGHIYITCKVASVCLRSVIAKKNVFFFV